MGSFDPVRYDKLHARMCMSCLRELLIVGLLTGMYAATGTLFSVVKRGENDGKVCIHYYSAHTLCD